jgi:YD repeat-containing protein
LELGRSGSGDGLNRHLVYGSLHQLTQVEEWNSQAWLSIDVRSLDSKGNATTYTYDKAYRVASMLTPATKAQFSYDVLDNLLSVTDKNGNITRYGYDGFGRKLGG